MKFHALLLSAMVFAASFAFGQAPQAPVTPPPPSPPQEATTPPAPPPAKPAPKPVKPTDTVLWIGDEGITAERLDAILKAVPPQYEGAVAQIGKKQFASQYGMLRGLAKLAEKEKIDQSSSFKNQLDFVRMELLARLAFNEVTKGTQFVPDEEIKKYYKEHEGEFQQAKVRGIFISLTPPSKPGEKKEGQKDEAKKEESKTRTHVEAMELALKLRQKILAGADFAAVAKESSDDASTAVKGGDFGTVRRGQLPPNIEKAVFSLKPKEVSEPVQEARGYYLFLVDEARTTTLDEATPQIRGQLQQQKLVTALDKVKAEYPVKFNDDYFEQRPDPAAQGPRITGVAPAQPATAPAPAKPTTPPAPPKK